MLLFILLLLAGYGHGEKCVPVPTCHCSSDTYIRCRSSSAGILPNITSFHVERIFIYHANVGFIPEYYFQRFKKLNSLKIVGGKFVYLPRHASSGLSSLEILDIRYSQLRLIHSHAFNNLTKLRYLNLDGNKLRNIPREAFLNLPSLYSLSLRNNFLHSINLMFRSHANPSFIKQQNSKYIKH